MTRNSALSPAMPVPMQMHTVVWPLVIGRGHAGEFILGRWIWDDTLQGLKFLQIFMDIFKF